MPNLAPSILSSFATDLLAAGGMTAEEAAIVGPSLANANTCGYSSHGVMRIPFYLDMLKVGDVKSNVELTAIEEGASTFVGDANWGIGRVQCGRLLDHLVPKAKQYGNAIGTLRNSGHIGRLGEYCEIAANEHGLVSRKETYVNWDPIEQTVLANEQVINGRGWRSNAIVERKKLSQWFFNISKFSEELLEGLNGLKSLSLIHI